MFYHLLSTHHNSMPQSMVTYCIIALLISVTSIGLLLENHRFGLHLEVLRCIAFLYFKQKFLPLVQIVSIDFTAILHSLLFFSFILSSLLCSFIIIFNLRFKLSLVFCRFERMSRKHGKLS
jgi:hypothetical protein